MKTVTTPMRSTFMIISALAVLTSGAVAATIDYTTGYTTGTLNNQQSWKTVSIGTGSGDFMVTEGQGLYIASGTVSGAALAVAHNGTTATSLALNTAKTLTMNFSFTESAATMSGTAGTMRSMVGLGLSEYSGDTPRLSVSFVRVAGSTDQYGIKLGYSGSTPTITSGATSVTFAASALGLDFANGDVTSDSLQLAYTVTRTVNYGAWTVTGMLTNMITGEYYSFTDTLTGASYYNAAYIEAILNGMSYDNSQVLGIGSVLATSYGAPLAVPEASTLSLLVVVGLLALALKRGQRMVTV